MTLDEFLLSQTKEELIEIYTEAMDLMQQWNGRSYTYCVIIAAGGEAEEQDDGTYKYTLPKEERTYNVRIARFREVEVACKSPEEALRAAQDMYHSGDACAELQGPMYTIVATK